jgi:hypothetical protein
MRIAIAAAILASTASLVAAPAFAADTPANGGQCHGQGVDNPEQRVNASATVDANGVTHYPQGVNDIGFVYCVKSP